MPRRLAPFIALLAGCASAPPVALVQPAPSASQQPHVMLAPPALRPPADAKPLRYDLELWLDPRAPEFHGKVGVDLDVVTATRVVWLDATDLAIDSATLDAGGTTSMAGVIPGGDDFVGFVFDHDVAPGKARLSITYHGNVDQERSRAIYAAREGDGEPYIYTFFEPTDARRAFPCFDEPSYKVPWKLSFHVPAARRRGSRQCADRLGARGGAGKLVELAETKPLPSYLVALVVGPFDVVDAGVAGHFRTPLRFIVPRGRGAETAYAASVTPKIVGYLEDYFGMPYPYGKLDVAVVPRYWGTMEHPGLVALGQPLTLIKEFERSVEREQRYTSIAAHELAHYWFGDYVTTAWWDDTWLNEALGTWMDAKISDRVDPAWHFDLERTDRAFVGMHGDALTTAKKIRQPVVTKSDIGSSFDNDITYFKGQSVVGMFEAWMTPERFQRAIRAYVAAHAFGSATAGDFLAALDVEQPGAGAAFASFVDQPGVPLVETTAVCEGGKREITVRQRRYQPLGAHVDAESWKMPVCVRYAKGARTSGVACTLLTGESATMPIDAPSCPAWIMGNADGRGYYHVAYAAKTLRDVLTKSSGISEAERGSALLDAVALVASGDLPLADALTLVPDTATSKNRYVVFAGQRIARLARESAMNDREAARDARFLHALYAPRAALLGFLRRPDDGVDGELLRSDLVRMAAVAGEDAPLRKRALELARAWLGDSSAVAPELVDTVLAAAGTTNDEALFTALLDRAKVETDHRKLGELLSALGRFTLPALAQKAQAIWAGTTFDVRDSSGILTAQLGARATRESAWQFLKSSFDSVAPRMRSDEVTYQLVEGAQVFCDEAHRADVKAFFEPRAAKYDGMAHAVATTVEAIGQCAAAFERNRAGLDAFLAKY